MKRLCLLILLVGCSHDAKRENPLDPELTPAIELTAAIDDTSGTVQLTWEPYDGRAPFAAYWVLRSQPRLSDVDTLATITDVTQLTFTDSLLDGDLEYNYHVSTVNQSGFEVASQEQRIRPLNLPPVQIEALTFDSATASAAISWTPYRGPRFKAYQVLRRTSELAAQVVEEIDDIAKTDFTDTGLRANTEYFYQVVVVTDRDEQIASTELSDALHRLVDTWALPAKSFTPSLRLYFEGGRIVALVDQGAQSGVMHLWTFDTTGQLLSDENFLGFAPASTLALAYARTASGRRLFALGNGGPFATHYGADGRTGDWDFVLVAQEPDGQLLMREHALSTEGFPALVAEAQRQVLGEVVLLLGGKYGRVKIATADRVFFDDDFTDFPADLNGWTTETFPEYRPDASPIVKDWILRLDNPFNDGITSRSDPEWRNFYLETEVIASSEGQQFAPTIQIGGDTFSRYTLKLSLLDQQAELTWLFSPPDDSELEAREVRISEPLPVIDSFSNWLRLGAVDGQVSASVLSPALISDVIDNASFPWTSLALIGDTPALTVYDQAYTLTPDGQQRQVATPFDAGVGETRVWEDRRGTKVGVCLPQLGSLRMGRVPSGQEANWSEFMTENIGPSTGRPADQLIYPTSFDVGPDGRIYILDAGNARIVVFSSGRRYITEWGYFGDGEGEFNFGRGGRTSAGDRAFAGSLVVDDEGFIYVVDEANARIQKFAP